MAESCPWTGRLARKKAADTPSSLSTTEYFWTVKAFVCFFLFRGESPKFRWLGKSFETEAKAGGGGPQLSVGESTHVKYLLLVQQEMMNDNKLGKERQQNKQIVSHPFCHF